MTERPLLRMRSEELWLGYDAYDDTPFSIGSS